MENPVLELNKENVFGMVKSMSKGDISLPRNPLITRIFRIIDLAENAGYGFDKMFKGWRYYYSKNPVVFSGLDYYKIEFFFDEKKSSEKTTQKILLLLKENPEFTRKELLEFVKKRVGSKLVEKVGSKLVENQLKIILLMNEKQEITKKELSEIIGISTTAIDKNIEKLKNLKIIKRIGPDKGGYWKVLG